MASEIEELVGMLYDMVQEAWALPFGAEKCLLDREKVLDLVEEIRTNLPKDLEQAKTIVENRNDIISQAKREAEAIRRSAEDHARHLVAGDELTLTTRQKANEIMANADAKSKEMRRVANEYADDTLRRIEEMVAQALGEVKKSRQQFKAAINKPPAPRQDEDKK